MQSKLTASSYQLFFEFSSKVDEYGFTRSDDFNYDIYGDFMSKYLKVLATRAKKWAALMKNDKYLSQGKKLKRYIRKGIPNEHRGEVSTVCSLHEVCNFVSTNFKWKINCA